MLINGRFLSQELTGVQRYAVEMTRAMRRLRPDVQVVSPRRVLHRELASEFSAVAVGWGSGYYWEQVELPALLKSKPSPPVLLNFANLAPALYERNVVVIHDVAPLRHPEWYSKRFRLAYRTLLPVIARRALQVVTDSGFAAREIRELLPVHSSRLAVVPGAASDLFLNTTGTEPPLTDYPYILTVGSFDPRKNLKTTIEAYRQLQLPGVQLAIVGRSNRVFAAQDGVLADANTAGIHLQRNVSDAELKAWYAHAALFVFPSHYEGFGLPPLEAMACGCPCLLSTAASLPEVFGDAAAYCDPNDVQDVAQRMRDLLQNEPLRMMYRHRGLARASSYSWDRSAKLFLDAVDHPVIS